MNSQPPYWTQPLTDTQRIELAKNKMEKVLDHFLYLLEINANNMFVVYNPTLSSQIPASFAANAFNIFQKSMHQFEIVRLCALWDKDDIEKENIPTVIQLIDEDRIIETLSEETRRHWAGVRGHLVNPSSDPTLASIQQEEVKHSNVQFGNDQAAKATAELKQTIADVKAILQSPRLALM